MLTFATFLAAISEHVTPQPFDVPDRIGGTGYLDSFTVEDLPSAVCIGEDKHGRKFVAFKQYGETETFVETVFERYNNRKDVLTSGGGPSGDVLVKSALDQTDLDYIVRLVSGQPVGVRDEYDYDNEKWLENGSVALAS